MNIYLKNASENDAEIVSDLANIIWHAHYTLIIGEQQVKYMLEKMYSINTLKNNIKLGPQEFHLIFNNEIPVGFISFEKKSFSEGFLNKFYILQNDQNKGIGQIAFDLLLKKYPEVKSIRLQVNRQNIKPINFYFKVGFKIEKAADFDIGDGYFMNDFVMIYSKNIK
jgi:ribosomal protein S18 acetylase RimI-like enzyme